uniref:Uncharacterized protein n=1 Tax=Octopus bimaculoides TaxID=37653 RepID=A0A0L8FTM3_OCTBM
MDTERSLMCVCVCVCVCMSHKESKKHSREEKQTETTASDKSRNTIPPWKKDLIEKKKKPFNPVNGVSEVFRRRAQMAKESPFTQQVVNTGPLSHGPSTVYRRRFSPSNSDEDDDDDDNDDDDNDDDDDDDAGDDDDDDDPS